MPHGDQYLEKPLPSSTDSERAILGAIILEPSLIAQAAELLRPSDMYSLAHRRIYAAMLALFSRQETFDPIVIAEELKKDSALEAVGGIPFITNLTYGVPHMSDINTYVEIVRAKSRVRALIQTCGVITADALAEDREADAVLISAQGLINDVCTDEMRTGFEWIAHLAERRLLEKFSDTERKTEGLATGFARLDEMTDGLQKTDLIILGAPPRTGKSVLASNVAVGACSLDNEAVVAIFSLEMSKEQYIDRMLCATAGIDYQRFRKRWILEAEVERLKAAHADFSNWRIEIDDTGGLNSTQVYAKSLMLKAKYGRLDLIIIDMLQKMSPKKESGNREQVVADIARDLKNIAKDMRMPVMALSSLSRAAAARQSKLPQLSDLRDSGNIESEADLVIFVHRDHTYNPDISPRFAQFIIAKHRNGPEGFIPMTFEGEYQRFSEPEQGSF